MKEGKEREVLGAKIADCRRGRPLSSLPHRICLPSRELLRAGYLADEASTPDSEAHAQADAELRVEAAAPACAEASSLRSRSGCFGGVGSAGREEPLVLLRRIGPEIAIPGTPHLVCDGQWIQTTSSAQCRQVQIECGVVRIEECVCTCLPGPAV